MDFAKAIAEEKKRIKSAITDLNIKKNKLDKEIASLEKEMSAIQAYEQAKQGKTVRRSRKTSVRAQILALIKSKPSTRAEIIEALGFQDEKGKQQTVSNTLSTLKKKGKIFLNDGVYSST